MTLSLISALSKPNRGIGIEHFLPWSLPEDLKVFKEITYNKIIIMGSTTFKYDLYLTPLPGRFNVVLTNTLPFPITIPEKNVFFFSVKNAKNMLPIIVEQVKKVVDSGQCTMPFLTYDEVLVIGGQSIFEQFIPLADKLYLTEIDQEIKCDKFFPDYSDFELEMASNKHSHNNLEYSFNVYKR